MLQPVTHCGTMLQGSLNPSSQESEVHEVSESITAAGAKPGCGPSRSLGLVWWRWWYVVLSGGKLAWAPQHCLGHPKIGQGAFGMVRGGGESGMQGECQVVGGCRKTEPASWLTPLFQQPDRMPYPAH